MLPFLEWLCLVLLKFYVILIHMPAAQGMSWYSSRRTTKFSKLNGFIEPILYDSSNQDISINYVSLISFCVPHEENWIARFAMVKNRMGTTRAKTTNQCPCKEYQNRWCKVLCIWPPGMVKWFCFHLVFKHLSTNSWQTQIVYMSKHDSYQVESCFGHFKIPKYLNFDGFEVNLFNGKFLIWQ